MRAYLDGKEIGEIPELREICALQGNDWFPALMKWIAVNRPGIQIQIIIALEGADPDNGTVLELWMPEAPANRAMEIGGYVKTLTQKKEAAS